MLILGLLLLQSAVNGHLSGVDEYTVIPLSSLLLDEIITEQRCRDGYLRLSCHRESLETVSSASIKVQSESLYYRYGDLEAIEVRNNGPTTLFVFNGMTTEIFSYRPNLGEYSKRVEGEKDPAFRNIYSLEGFGLCVWGMSFEELVRQRQLNLYVLVRADARNSSSYQLFFPFSRMQALEAADLVASLVLDSETMLISRIELLSRAPVDLPDDVPIADQVLINGSLFLRWLSGEVTSSVPIPGSPYQYPTGIVIQEKPQPLPCPIFEMDLNSFVIRLVAGSQSLGFNVQELSNYVNIPEGYLALDPLSSDYQVIGEVNSEQVLASTGESNIATLLNRLLNEKGRTRRQFDELADMLSTASCGVQAAALCALEQNPQLPLDRLVDFKSSNADKWMTVAEVASFLSSIGDVSVFDYQSSPVGNEWSGVLLMRADEQYYDENHFVFATRQGQTFQLFDPLLGYKSLAEEKIRELALIGITLAPSRSLRAKTILSAAALLALLAGSIIMLLRKGSAERSITGLCLVAAVIFSISSCRDKAVKHSEVLQAVTSTEVDLGQILPEKAYSGTFEVRNVSSTAIAGLHVRASCGCSATSIDKEDLNPGESAVIHFDFTLPRGISRTSEVMVLAAGFPEPLQTFFILGHTAIENDWQTVPDVMLGSILPDEPFVELGVLFRLAYTGEIPSLSLGGSNGVLAEQDEQVNVSRSLYRDYSIAEYRINVVVLRSAITSVSSRDGLFLNITPCNGAQAARDTLTVPIKVEVVDEVEFYPVQVRVPRDISSGTVWMQVTSKFLQAQEITRIIIGERLCRVTRLGSAQYRIDFDAGDLPTGNHECLVEFNSEIHRTLSVSLLRNHGSQQPDEGR